jgi:hypothetical protein
MITLNASAVLSFLTGGVAVETDDHAALTGMSIDWTEGRANFMFHYGTWAGGAFTPGLRPGPVTVTVDLARGGWTVTTGQMGQLSPSALAAVVANLSADRNTLESWAAGAGGNLLPGVTSAW